MKVSRIINKSACKVCGGTSISFKLEKALTLDILPLLEDKKYRVKDNFTRSGILYVENDAIIITGAFNTTNLQTKCKKSDCSKYIDELEVLLSNFG